VLAAIIWVMDTLIGGVIAGVIVRLSLLPFPTGPKVLGIPVSIGAGVGLFGYFHDRLTGRVAVPIRSWILSDTPLKDLSDGLVVVAARLAGGHRSHAADEWRAHLAGAPEDGLVVTGWTRVRDAAGFVLAAARYRLHDLTAPAWRPVEWLLSSSRRTHTFIAVAVGSQALIIVGHDGLYALVTDALDPCAVMGGGMFILARWLRRLRGIELTAARSDESADE
jgi:hypothetical protein